MKEIVVFVTTSSEEEAVKISRVLVEKKLVACANIVPKVRSIFSWEGKIEEEQESLIIFKSTESRFEKLMNKIKDLHSYSVPEVISLPINQGLPEYLKWMHDMTQESPP